MSRLGRSLGIDGRQFRALVGVALKLDLRIGSATAQGTTRKTGLGRPIRLLIAYALAGAGVAFFISPAQSLFAASLVHVSALALMMFAVVVLEFNSIVLSADDAQIFGHQPVTSSTFFFSRLAHSLLYTQILGLAFSLAPLYVIASSIRGPQPVLAAVALLAASATGMVVTLAGVACYAGILRFVRPSRLRSMLTWTQLGLSLAVYGTFLLVRRRPQVDALPDWSLASSPEMLLFPPSWFAAWVDLAERGSSWAGWSGALLSLAAGLAWVTFSARVISLSYAERLAALQEESGRESSAPRRLGLLFRQREARAIGLLVPRQFRHDYRFRLGVLGVLPLTLLYLVIALEEGPPADPFVASQMTQGSALLYLAVLISPALLVPGFVYSDAFPASWLYYVTPADLSRLVLGVRNYIAVSFILPYLTCVAGVFAYFYGSLWHALAHAAVLGLCSGLFLLLAMLFNPGLPFASPVQRGRFSLRTLVPFVVAPLFSFGLLPFLIETGYRSLGAVGLCLLGLAATNLLCGRFVAWRIASRAAPLRLLG